MNGRTTRGVIGTCAAVLAFACGTAHGMDAAHRAKAEEMRAKAAEWLRGQQDVASGGWKTAGEGPQFPAISAMAATGLVREGGATNEAAAERAAGYILTFRQADGGIYDRILPSYNTSIVLSFLAHVDTPESREAIKDAQDFLRSLQWSEASSLSSATPEISTAVDKSHPFYGGIGYGRHGRPDLSNLAFMLQGLHDTGVPGEDPAFQRALVFLARVQMVDSVNDMPYADGTKQGGFIYATSVNKDQVGSGQTQVAEQIAMVEETLDDGTKVSRLRCYGSMTYAGFKSLIYADLARDDERVRAAYDWIRRFYTMDENPAMGTDGLYYYYVMASRALRAWGGDEIVTLNEQGGSGATRDWANDLVDALAELQEPDGSFRSVDDRWMENNTLLITAYSLLSLQEASGVE
ncbi:MAG: prenyltransferase/squalene oxidase repeat-containing protein [Phycisphaerales bacterium]